MVESLIGMGRYFCWGLSLFFVLLVLYALFKRSIVSYTPIMVILGVVLPFSAFTLVSAAVGAYLGSLLDSLLGISNMFAAAGIVGGLFVGITLWRRARGYPAG